jgi:hypothetical protein
MDAIIISRKNGNVEHGVKFWNEFLKFFLNNISYFFGLLFQSLSPLTFVNTS